MKIHISDSLTPALTKLLTLSMGWAQEGLQVAGAKTAQAARSEMRKMSTQWFKWVNENGTYRFGKAGVASQELGRMMSHSTGRPMKPYSISAMIKFYLPDNSLTVVVGGAMPRFRPKRFEKGVAVGRLSTVSPVSVKTRAILHKLNTGEVTSEHPYSVKTAVKNATYVKNRRFMEKGYAVAKPGIRKSIEDRYAEGFTEAFTHIKVNPRIIEKGA